MVCNHEIIIISDDVSKHKNILYKMKLTRNYLCTKNKFILASTARKSAFFFVRAVKKDYTVVESRFFVTMTLSTIFFVTFETFKAKTFCV